MIITIYNTKIEASQIVGVGPLIRVHKSTETAMAFNIHTLQFQLYLLNYSITICTDDLKFSGADKDQSMGEYEAIREAHQLIVKGLGNGSLNELGNIK